MSRLSGLALFPLRTVLFPGGLLLLKVFEARYLDMIGHCMRTGSPFGVVCIAQGQEVGATSAARLESVGVLARLDCTVHARSEVGDHLVVVGRVEGFEASDGEALTYFRGRYGLATSEISE